MKVLVRIWLNTPHIMITGAISWIWSRWNNVSVFQYKLEKKQNDEDDEDEDEDDECIGGSRKEEEVDEDPSIGKQKALCKTEIMNLINIV